MAARTLGDNSDRGQAALGGIGADVVGVKRPAAGRARFGRVALGGFSSVSVAMSATAPASIGRQIEQRLIPGTQRP